VVEYLLDIASHLGGAEAFDGTAVADARQEIGRTVALICGQRRRIDPLTAVPGDELHLSHSDRLALARRPRLVNERGAGVAVDDHGESRLSADLRPARLQ
jgi:hypothetical protein